MASQERNLSLDLIKIAAMIGVMTLHVTVNFENYDDWVSRYVFSMAGLSMPLFFMVSGYLMLGREVSFKYLATKTFKIVKFVFLMCLLYWLCGWFGDRSWKSLLSNFVFSFIKGGKLSVFWYFGSIIICYWMLPLFNKIAKNRFAFRAILLSLFVLLSITWTMNLSGGFEASIRQTFRLWNWFFYFLLGGFLKVVFQENKELILHRWGGQIKYFKWVVLFLLGIVYMDIYLRVRPILDNSGIEYMFGCTLCVVIAIFVFVCFLTTEAMPQRIIGQLSSLFLPVYALHMQVIRLLKAEVFFLKFGDFAPFIEWSAVVFLTMTVSWILMKIPYVNRIFKI